MTGVTVLDRSQSRLTREDRREATRTKKRQPSRRTDETQCGPSPVVYDLPMEIECVEGLENHLLRLTKLSDRIPSPPAPLPKGATGEKS